jgi:hypothetical protein
MYDILNDIQVSYGETIRTNCPSCKGYNTFSVSNIGGSIVWNCYKASCNVKGSKNVLWSIDDIKNMNNETKEKEFELPKHIVKHTNIYMDRWCARWGLEKEELGLLNDVKEDRVVFLIVHNNKIVDATGRALTKRQPKWKRYGFSSLPYTYGSGDVAVVVEDCVSAAVVGNVKNLVGVALLGTSLGEEHKQYLAQFSTVLVALDPDAVMKSSYHAQELSNHVENVKVLNLEQDIKYRNPADMHKLEETIWN